MRRMDEVTGCALFSDNLFVPFSLADDLPMTHSLCIPLTGAIVIFDLGDYITVILKVRLTIPWHACSFLLH